MCRCWFRNLLRSPLADVPPQFKSVVFKWIFAFPGLHSDLAFSFHRGLRDPRGTSHLGNLAFFYPMMEVFLLTRVASCPQVVLPPLFVPPLFVYKRIRRHPVLCVPAPYFPSYSTPFFELLPFVFFRFPSTNYPNDEFELFYSPHSSIPKRRTTLTPLFLFVPPSD